MRRTQTTLSKTKKSSIWRKPFRALETTKSKWKRTKIRWARRLRSIRARVITWSKKETSSNSKCWNQKGRTNCSRWQLTDCSLRFKAKTNRARQCLTEQKCTCLKVILSWQRASNQLAAWTFMKRNQSQRTLEWVRWASRLKHKLKQVILAIKLHTLPMAQDLQPSSIVPYRTQPLLKELVLEALRADIGSFHRRI